VTRRCVPILDRSAAADVYKPPSERHRSWGGLPQLKKHRNELNRAESMPVYRHVHGAEQGRSLFLD